MKVLIIEDEELAAGRLRQMLLAEDPGMEIHGPVESVKNAIKHLQEARDYDLIFMDIQLADGRSFTIFERIKVDTAIIFTTAYDEFAVKAFEQNSVDYLLKPIHQPKLKASLEKYHRMKGLFRDDSASRILSDFVTTFRQQESAYQSRFLVIRGDSMQTVPVADVAYFSADDKIVFLHKHDGQRHIINSSLEELEGRVDPKTFFRVNRQYLVSIRSIQKVHYHFNYKLKLELNPIPGEDVIVSKVKASSFKEWLNG